MPAKGSSAKNKSKDQQIAELKAKIKDLELQNAALSNKHQAPKAEKPSFVRRVGVSILITLSVISFMFFNVANWVKASIIETDGFLAITQPLIEQPAVQQTLQQEISNALFDSIDLESELSATLPENLKFLAGPLSGQIESFTTDKIGEVIASQELKLVWDTTLETIHTALVQYINSEEADGVISLNDVYTFTSEQLEGSQVGFLLNKQLPDNIGNITVAEISALDNVRQYFSYIERIPGVFLFISLISFAAALLLSAQKKKTIITTIVLLFIIMISTLLALVIGREIIQSQANPNYSAAISEVYTVITNPLMARAQGYLAILSVVLIMLIVTSQAKTVTMARALLIQNFKKGIYHFTPAFSYPQWLNWSIKNKNVVSWTAFVLLFVVIGVRIPPEYNQVISGFLIAGILSLLYLAFAEVLIAAKQKQK